MRISSGLYDYSSLSSLSKLLSRNPSGNDSTSSESTGTTSVSGTSRRTVGSLSLGDLMGLTSSGQKVRDALRSQRTEAAGSSEQMDLLKEKLDTLSETDVEELTDDEAKTLLSEVMSAFAAAAPGGSSASGDTDVSDLTAEEAKEVLSQIQAQGARRGGGPGGMPPGPPPGGMGGPSGAMQQNMNALLEADTETLSTDELKTILESIQEDLEELPEVEDGLFESLRNTDLDSLSDEEIASTAKSLQEKAASAPMGPPPKSGESGMQFQDLLSLFSTEEDEEDSSLTLSDKLLSYLTESFDSSTESSDRYVETLKTSIADMIEQQKEKMDTFSSSLYSLLDTWNTRQKG